MIYNDPALAAAPLAERIAAAQHILILTHINPDGDAVGATLGVWHALGALGKQRTAILMRLCQGIRSGSPASIRSSSISRGWRFHRSTWRSLSILRI